MAVSAEGSSGEQQQVNADSRARHSTLDVERSWGERLSEWMEGWKDRTGQPRIDLLSRRETLDDRLLSRTGSMNASPLALPRASKGHPRVLDTAQACAQPGDRVVGDRRGFESNTL